MRLRFIIAIALVSIITLAAALAETLSQTQNRRHAPVPGASQGKQASSLVRYDHHILVDQFGYRPGDPKVAVIRDPVQGYDAADRFAPGRTYLVRRADDGQVVFAGHPVVWNHGAVEASSGDRGWWFDFSSVTMPGRYFVMDVSNKARSAIFSIDPLVYLPVLKAAVRMYFYQRSGFAKRAPYVPECWQDGPAYLGKDQDTQAHDITDPKNPAKVKDLSGGWFDAGDTNKYVTNAVGAVHQLLTAYEANTVAFTDDFDIPESNNGVPDILDEVNWEINWLKKMQYPDGSSALKVGALGYPSPGPPSSDRSARYYVPSCSSSTIAIAGMFAHASLVFRKFPTLADDASDLEVRATGAWRNFQSISPKQTHCDSGTVKVPGADLSATRQLDDAVVAAVYLYALTGTPSYGDYVRAHYRQLRPYHDLGWLRYDPFEGQALLFYATLPNSDPTVSKRILSDYRSSVHGDSHIYGFSSTDDLYRSYLHDAQYHWGSNEVRADYGNSNVSALQLDDEGARQEGDLTRALDTLHYFDGVNPFAKVYLTNMYAYGATSSVNELYHMWFSPNCNRLFCTNERWTDVIHSACGPPPGYLPGGPVANVTSLGVPTTLVPPSGQPPQKSYRDTNRSYPDKAFIYNEPSIGYQAAYVQLISSFVN